MRILIYFLIVHLFLCGCNSNKPIKSDLNTENLKGSIKSFKETQYNAIEKFGEIQKGDILTEPIDRLTGIYEANFNIDGNFVLEVSYDSNGSIYSKTEYVYNSNGLKIGANTYNEENILDGMELFTFDENLNLIDYSILNADSSLHWRYRNQFDGDGNEIESILYNSEGEPLSNEVYKYDSKGYKIERSSFSPNGNISSRTNYVNDRYGNVVEVSIDDPAIENSLGSIAPRYFVYTYDKVGNWVIRIEYLGSNRKPKVITERLITYY